MPAASLSAPVALLGIPWDAHSSHARGPAAGPAAIRNALADGAGNWVNSRGRDLRDPGILIDVGDVAFDGATEDIDAITGAVSAQLALGRPVLSLGGDHALTWPVFRAYAEQWSDIAIVHVDAHPDLHDAFEGDPLSHASPFARIMERDLAPRLIQIGIRASDEHQRAQAAGFGVETFAPERFGEALACLPTGRVYLTIDLDGLDPAFAPGVNHYEPGGLTTRELLTLIEALPGPIVGADIVELCPARDHQDMTAKLAAKLTKELVGRMSPPR